VLGRSSVLAQLLEGSILHMCVFIVLLCPSTLLSQIREQDEAIGSVCVHVSALYVCLSLLICMDSHIYLSVCVLCVLLPTGNIYSASLLLGPGAWSCSSLASVRASKLYFPLTGISLEYCRDLAWLDPRCPQKPLHHSLSSSGQGRKNMMKGSKAHGSR